MKYKDYFNTVLLELAETEFKLKSADALRGALPPKPKDRPQHGSGESEMQDTLEPETDPSQFNPEGLPEEAIGSIVTQVAQQVREIANELNDFNSRLINPNDENSFLSRLASKEINAIPEFQEAAEVAAKQLAKAQPAIGAAITSLNTLVTMAENRKRDRQKADAQAAATSQAPY